MRNSILAKRYAKALFAVGKEENGLEEYNKILKEISELFAMVPEVGDALTNFLYPQEARAKVMEHLITKLKVPRVMGNFLKLVVQKRRADVLPDIAVAFQALVNQEQNICQGAVISAAELSSALIEQVKQKLENITGKKVVLSTQVDPAIIGGIIAQVGDLVIDGSIKTQLTGLKESIKRSE